MVATPEPYYSDDHVTIYHGDSRDIVPRLRFDVVVTDPPYGIGWSRGVHSARNSKSHDGIVNDEDTSARDETLALCGAVPAAVFGSFYAPYPRGVKQILVWRKPADAGVVGSTTGYRRDVEPVFLTGDWPQRHVQWSALLQSHQQSISHVARETGHPHTKPLDIVRDLVRRCPPGVVLDPFMGSGTTLRAAKDLGRKAIGVEIEKRYCAMAVRRLRQECFVFEDAS
jgi:DNA modification methylase